MAGSETLYAQLGGVEAIEAVVDRFYERVLADERVSGFFDDTDMDRLRRHQTLFLSTVTGGPVEYTGRDVRTAHAGLELTEEHFAVIAIHLRMTLEEFDVDDDSIETIMAEVAALKDDVLGR